MIPSNHHGESDHVAIFASPRAGSGAGREAIPRLIEQLQHDGIQVCTCQTAIELEQWRRQRCLDAPRSKSTIVAAGGDGTITLAASILLQMNAPDDSTESDSERQSPCLLPMPLGTENLLAKHFRHQANAAAVRNTIHEGARKSLDMGMVHRITDPNSARRSSTPKPMLTMVSCGFDADVVRQVHLKRKGHIRRLSYFGPIIRAMQSYPFPELNIEVLADDGTVDQQLQGGWAMVFNLPRYAGGLQIEPDAVGTDGWLDLIVFKGRTRMTGLKYLAGIHAGTHLRHPDTTRVKAKRIRITSDQRVHYQIDGDYVGRLPIEITIRPKAIDFLIPPP